MRKGPWTQAYKVNQGWTGPGGGGREFDHKKAPDMPKGFLVKGSTVKVPASVLSIVG